MHRISFPAAVLAALLFAPGDDAGAASSAGLFDSVVLARGKDLEVRRGQLDDAFVAFKANLAVRGQTIPEDKRLQVEAQLLDSLVVSQILVHKATAADKAKAREKAAQFIEGSRREAGSEEAFLRRLKALSMTPQQFTNRALDEAVGREMIQRDIRSKVTITPDQIQKFYETNDAAFRQPEMARVSTILIATRDLSTRLELPEAEKKAKRDKAEKTLARARKGEDFTKLAEECSDDLAVKENKGEYRFTRAKDDPRRSLMPEFEAAAFALRPGEISGLVLTEYGYHIIKLIEITPARKTPLTEVSERVRDHLMDQETNQQLPGYFARLKQEAEVQILDQKLAEALAQMQKEAGK